MIDQRVTALLTGHTFSATFDDPVVEANGTYRQDGRLHLLSSGRPGAAAAFQDPTGEPETWARMTLRSCAGGGYALVLHLVDVYNDAIGCVTTAWSNPPSSDDARKGLARFLASHHASMAPNPLAEPEW